MISCAPHEELRQFAGDVLEQRLVGKEGLVEPVHPQGALVDRALRVDVAVEMAAGEAAIDHLDGRHLDDAVARATSRPVVSVSRTICLTVSPDARRQRRRR
jgi:hypothetical protein